MEFYWVCEFFCTPHNSLCDGGSNIWRRTVFRSTTYKSQPCVSVFSYAILGRIKKKTRQVSSMIHSARPIVAPLANIVFGCFVFLDLKSGNGRTDGRTDMCKNNYAYLPDFGLAEWIKKRETFYKHFSLHGYDLLNLFCNECTMLIYVHTHLSKRENRTQRSFLTKRCFKNEITHDIRIFTFICLCTDNFLPQLVCLRRTIIPAAFWMHISCS